ncbi:MAG TPA: hypothetical protein VEB64_16200 [Azospirillaceae bacterium]|nr:hypothetical protein [Azospirillaceae bacterium]
MEVKVAVVGLGRVGAEFLEELLEFADKGVEIVCAAEPYDTPGKALALEKGVRVGTVDDILALGDEVDIIFELTGSKSVRRMIREGLGTAHNEHTTLVPEIMARLIRVMTTDSELPEVHKDVGY